MSLLNISSKHASFCFVHALNIYEYIFETFWVACIISRCEIFSNLTKTLMTTHYLIQTIFFVHNTRRAVIKIFGYWRNIKSDSYLDIVAFSSIIRLLWIEDPPRPPLPPPRNTFFRSVEFRKSNSPWKKVVLNKD